MLGFLSKVMPPLLSALKSVPFVDCILLVTNENVKEIIKNILFDFLENRKYNDNERVADERKSSFMLLVFLLLNRIFAMKKVCSLSA